VLSGLVEEFGKIAFWIPRFRSGFTGLGRWRCLTGLRPIVDIMFGDFITLTWTRW